MLGQTPECISRGGGQCLPREGWEDSLLRIRAQKSSRATKDYYAHLERADYYSESRGHAGTWFGRGAKRLGLSGEVEQEDFFALCDNRRPDSGKKLTARSGDHRIVGYDFNFNCPKSISLIISLTGDHRLLKALQESVRETMAEIESAMETRVRTNGAYEDRNVGNMVWSEFVHTTARPVEGQVPDPNLHTHAFAFNAVHDEVEDRWKAGKFHKICRDAPLFDARYQSRLAEKLLTLGYSIEQHRRGWDIAGIDRELIEKFSRRQRQIEEEAAKQGITDAKGKGELGARTRSKKVAHLTNEDLHRDWKSRLTAAELFQLRKVREEAAQDSDGGGSGILSAHAAKVAVDHALGHCFERRSVMRESLVLAIAIKHAVGRATAEQVTAAFEEHPDIICRKLGSYRYVTTRTMLEMESRMIGLAKLGKYSCAPFGDADHQFKAVFLDQGQRRAVLHLLTSRDKLMAVRGPAGAGKSSMMQEAISAIEEKTGRRVFTFAPTAMASRHVLRDKGFHDADTVQQLFNSKEKQEQIRGQCIWIDEAGLLSVRQMLAIFELAESSDARVVLSGDVRQHRAVEAGDALRILQARGTVVPAELTQIHRQQGAYREAMRRMGDGDVPGGYCAMEELGWVHEVANDNRHEKVANDYLDVLGRNKTSLVVAPTHLEGRKVTELIRKGCGPKTGSRGLRSA
ncbi:MAG: relaxase domain-containing protein [Verrucomicrobiae bacterium]|nr:relaxase domain-containing protein [Verrucomicrobiae bacterium]